MSGSDEFTIAVVAMAGRFPGASDIGEFWRNLRAGVVSTRRFSRSELLRAGVSADHVDDPRYVPVCAPLDRPYDFDAGLFRVGDNDARLMDPQHRLLLECAWQALESAGLLAEDQPRPVGVFAGGSEGRYRPLVAHTVRDELDGLALELGTAQDYLATRVSHLLDLTGPALSVSTACSTSLVALHLAVQSLVAGECRAAVVGSAAIRFPLHRGHRHEAGGIYSADGQCRPYDAAAGGIVSGDGVGALVLKPLTDALADGDHVHAVIRGTATNNDGAAKSGFTAPSVRGQTDVIRAALDIAGVDPDTIGYVEGHGTGTRLGDPIELAALTRAWREYTSRESYCSLGSVKANIGHLDASAGLAGLIKACLAVEHGIIPGIPTFDRPNPEFDLARTPFLLHREARAWPSAAGPRRAAVHSLGLGGTNAHVVIEQAPDRPATPTTGPVVLTLSARTPATLDSYAASCAAELRAAPESAAAAAVTTRSARTAFPVRRAEVGLTGLELASALDAGRPAPPPRNEPPPVTFLFPGGGSWHSDMGHGLYDRNPVFRHALNGLIAPVRDVLELDLPDLLWGERKHLLSDPGHGFVAIVAISLAMADTVAEYGVRPQRLLGYSLGELPAAALAGIFDTTAVLSLAALRGDLFARMQASGSTHVFAAPELIDRIAPPSVTVGVVNGEEDCVISGPLADLVAFEEVLTNRGTDHRRIAVPGAVHSPLLDPLLGEYRDLVADLSPRPPRLPVVSNVTGRVLTPQQATDPGYWVSQLRQRVVFDECVRTAAEGGAVLVDLGPGRGLESVVRPLVAGVDGAATCALMRSASKPRAEEVVLASGFATLWEHGVEVDFSAFTPTQNTRVAFPVAPFVESRYAPDERPSTLRQTGSGTARLWQRTWHRWSPVPVSQQDSYFVFLTPDDAAAQPYRAAVEKTGVLAEVANTVEQVRDVVRAVDAALRVVVVDLRPPAVPSVLELADVGAGRRVGLWFVGHGMADVLGVEDLDPSAAMLPATCLVLGQERPELDVLCLDVGMAADPAASLASLLGQVDRPVQLAVRGHAIFAPGVAPVRVPDAVGSPWRANGVYLITGGLGRYGRWLAECLAGEVGATVLLVQRSPLPLHPEDADGAEARRRAAAVHRIEAAGGTVELITVDITDEPAFGAALQAAESRHGPVHGVIHAAGDITSWTGFSAADELIHRGLVEGLRTQSAAKVDGTEVLHRLFAGRELDFCALMSSNAGLLGGPGLALYSAVNAYLDAVAHLRRTRDGLPWTAVAWDGWRLAEDEAAPTVRSSLEEFALTGSEAFAAFTAALRTGLGSVSVSRGDLAERFAEWGRGAPGGAAPEPEPAAACPSTTDSTADGVLAIWREVVGTGRIGPDDDLFDVGGSSLAALRIRARLRGRFGADIPLGELLRHRTVSGMTRLVGSALRSAPPGDVPPRTLPAPDLPGADLAVPDLAVLLDQLDQNDASGGKRANTWD